MQKNMCYNVISLLLVVIILFNNYVPAMAQTMNNTNNTGKGEERGNPLTADYVLPDWEDDALSEQPERTKPPLYKDGKILIYHYSQLLMIGRGAAVTDTDYITNQTGNGQQILSDGGQAVLYAPDADYQIVQDIPLPRHTVWKLPDDFTGSLSGHDSFCF